ncbi:hypothetical protein [Radiobacillus sp. PE A8.2]|uniref:hypothetical protein n=1 Tax=Radiobacillus sp. PE A8.2 TaxID=3380349 RepID=UPI00388E7969
MTILREAVERQRQYMINKIITEGIAMNDDVLLHDKTITELVNEYEQSQVLNQ